MSAEPVAVIADPHYHDIRAGTAFRTLADTAESTRVFNESFAALPRLLDDIAARGIRLVALLGDLTDDGQAATTQAATALLHAYRERHGLRFFATPGNHDLFAIHGRHQSKRFLNPDGSHTLVTSDPAAPQGDSVAKLVDPGMYCGGYADALAAMADFGFFRRPDHLHWESPFGPDDALAARSFEIRSADGGTRRRIIDASYLVEPVEGLWLLSIDANVFEPRDGGGDPAAEASWIDSTDAGWNAMPRLKPFILDWMADVAARARAGGKRLLAFSHYPALDILGSAHADERALFGETGIVRRAPGAATARAVASTGIGVHFSGHLHVNATNRWRDADGFLVNVAVPSIVAFPPGYKIAAFAGRHLHVRTVALDDVPGHDARLRRLPRRDRPRGRRPRRPDRGVEPRRLPQPACRRARRSPLPAPGMARRHRRARRRARPRRACAPRGRCARGGRVPSMTLVEDWYRLRKGRDLAHPFIPAPRLAAWRALAAACAARDWPEGSPRRLGRRPPADDALLPRRPAVARLPHRPGDRRDHGRDLPEDAYRGRTERLQTGAA